MIGVLWGGQSAGRAMTDYQTAACPVPHPDTHHWNGTAFVAPTGDGMVTYCNWLRQLMNQPVYVINACVNGTPLLGATGTPSWVGSLAAASITMAQAALVAVPGLAIDRIEFWGCQTDCLAAADSQPIKDGLETLLGMYATAFPGSRFCVWPVGRFDSVVYAGAQSQQVVRGQMGFALADPLTREVGPSSHDLPGETLPHLTPGSYAVMGQRAAGNAKSYFDAKAAGTLAVHHLGAGPRITAIARVGNKAQVFFDVKPGAYLTPQFPFGGGDINATSNWCLFWGVGSKAQVGTTDGRVVGGSVILTAVTTLIWAVSVGHAAAQNYAGTDVYDSNGQVCLPITPEMLVSA